MNRVAAEAVKDEYNHKRCNRSQDRTTKRLRDARVDHVCRDLLSFTANFADPVKHNDRIVE